MSDTEQLDPLATPVAEDDSEQEQNRIPTRILRLFPSASTIA
jgi:hypothetical protein